MDRKGVQIGLRDIHVAILLDDPLDGTADYDVPERLPGAITANINPNASSGTLFADDGPYETASTTGEIVLELNVADLPLYWQAKLLGHTIEGGIMKRKSDDIPPWVGVAFRSLKSNGKYRYTWLNKGKFAASEQANATKGDSVEFQTPTITGSFVRRDSDDEWERHADEDDADYVPTIGTNWFTTPLDTVDDSPLTITVSPVDEDTSVAKDTLIKWTASKPLSMNTINFSHFSVLDGNTPVDGELTINVGKTIVTFEPDSDLDGSTEYTLVVAAAVRDIYGVALGVPLITTFETEA